MAGKNDKKVAKLKTEAVEALAKGKHKKALELYLQLSELEPRDATFRQRAGDCARKLDDLPAAIANYELAAETYSETGFLLKAIALCKTILDLDPSHTATQGKLATLHAAQRQALRGEAPLPAAPMTDPVAPEPPTSRAVLPPPKQPGPPPPARPRPVPRAIELVPDDSQVAGHPGARPAAASPGLAPPPVPRPVPTLASPAIELPDESSFADVGDDLAEAPFEASAASPEASPEPLPSPSGSIELSMSGLDLPPPAAEPSEPAIELSSGSIQLEDDSISLTAEERAQLGLDDEPSELEPTLVPARPGFAKATPEETSFEAPSEPAAVELDADEPIDLGPAPRPRAPRPAPPRTQAAPPPAPASPAAPRGPTPIAATPIPRGSAPPPRVAGMSGRTTMPPPRGATAAPPRPSGPPAPRRPTLPPGASRTRTTIPPGAALEAVSLNKIVSGSHSVPGLAHSPSGVHLIPLDDEFGDFEPAPAPPPAPPPSDGIPTAMPDVTSDTHTTAVNALPKTPLFSALDADSLQRLIETCRLVELAEGEVLFRQGEPGKALYVIADGEVAVTRDPSLDRRGKQTPAAKDASPHAIEVARLGEGSFFGEISLLTSTPHAATITATMPTSLLEIDRDVVGDLVDDRPDLLRVLLGFLRDRLLDLLLDTAPLFAPFSGDERVALLKLFKFIEVEPGSVIIKEGERSPGLFILLCGEVQVTLQEKVAADLAPGDLVGEMSMLTRKPAVATVTAHTKSYLLTLPSAGFQELILTHPQVLIFINDLAEERERANQGGSATVAGSFEELHLDML